MNSGETKSGHWGASQKLPNQYQRTSLNEMIIFSEEKKMETKLVRTKMTVILVVLAVFVMYGQVQADLADGLISHWELDLALSCPSMFPYTGHIFSRH